jgi:hypothetical protein
MDVIKEEADADNDVDPTLSKYETVHSKEECSADILCSVKNEFKFHNSKRRF